METLNPYRIIGVESSPYAVKVRAVMRYRHIPYRWIARMPQYFEETAAVSPLLMPVVQYPDGTYRTDSTPIIRDLESLHTEGPGVTVPAPSLDFLNDLIEDLADEWLTKSLFYYRFRARDDAQAGGGWVMDDAHPGLDPQRLQQITNEFIERQTNRMPLVGCTPENAPLLESFYGELLATLEPFVATDKYLFGSRPATADFALYGQLSTLGTDPTSQHIMRTRAPRTYQWMRRLDDCSGVTGEWDLNEISAPVRALCQLAGKYYLPFLAANFTAIEQGQPEVQLKIAGRDYRQPSNRYQRKCCDYLRKRYASLSQSARDDISPVLEAAGCLDFLG